jgi:hypothetical protein
MEQVIKSHNKKSKERKGIAKNFNERCFTYNKIGHLAKDYRNKGQKKILIKQFLKPMSSRLITLQIKF